MDRRTLQRGYQVSKIMFRNLIKNFYQDISNTVQSLKPYKTLSYYSIFEISFFTLYEVSSINFLPYNKQINICKYADNRTSLILI